MTVTHAHPRSNCCSPIRATAQPAPKNNRRQTTSRQGVREEQRTTPECLSGVWLRYSSVSLPCSLSSSSCLDCLFLDFVSHPVTSNLSDWQIPFPFLTICFY